MMMSASPGRGGARGGRRRAPRATGSSLNDAKFRSTDMGALGFARAGRGSERSAESGRVSTDGFAHAPARAGGGNPIDLLELFCLVEFLLEIRGPGRPTR